MKLRIRGNSIRFRLSKSEVVQFASSGCVEDRVEFGPAGSGLTYRLRATAENEMVRATFANNRLDVSVPKVDAANWINSELVGIETIQQIDDLETLHILVEKDFACLIERENEDETDAFPNPSAAASGGEI